MRILLALALSALTVVLLAGSGRLALRRELGGRLRGAFGALLLTLVMTLAVFLPVVSVGDIGDIDPRHLSLPALFLGHYVLLAFLFAWWLLCEQRPSISDFLSLKRPSWREHLRRGINTGLAAWMMAVAINLTIGGLLGSAGALQDPGGVPSIVVWFAGLGVGPKLLVIAMAMTVEEAFFRGFLQPRIGLWPSSVLFALGHFSYGLPFLVLGVFVVSVVLGRSFEQTRSLWPCIIGHGVFDAIQLFLILPLAVQAGSAGG